MLLGPYLAQWQYALRVSNDLNTSCSVIAVVGCLRLQLSGGTV